jgi:hypothetical protein
LNVFTNRQRLAFSCQHLQGASAFTLASMFTMRLEEHPLPTSRDDVDQLIDWLVATLGLVRRRADEHADGDKMQPVVRLLREHLLARPKEGIDAASLADEMGLTAASLHHHISRLANCRILSSISAGDGWRRHFLRAGSMSAAVELLAVEATAVMKLRMSTLEKWWKRPDDPSLDVELESADRELPFRLWISEPRPLPPVEGVTELSLWMADLGLLGDRPKPQMAGDSLAPRLMELLLQRGLPLSLDEAAAELGGAKARIGRILERFRAAGLVERVARTDRLATNLWTAMMTQYKRRGEDWVLLKGGFNRILPERQIESLTKALSKGKLTPEMVEKELSKVAPTEQMLLLNLLGGRLPLGHRMVGKNAISNSTKLMSRLDRVLRRMKRVAELLDKAMK